MKAYSTRIPPARRSLPARFELAVRHLIGWRLPRRPLLLKKPDPRLPNNWRPQA